MRSGRPPTTVSPSAWTYHENRYADALDRGLGVGCLWLDLGAGSRVHGGWVGASPPQLAARARLLVGIDVQPRHLRKNPQLRAAVVGAANDLPFRSRSVDLVSANMVVEHLEHPLLVLAEVARVLRSGGRFIFSTPNRRHPVVWSSALLLSRAFRKQAATFLERRPSAHVFHTFYRLNDERSIRHAARVAGLQVEELDLFDSVGFLRRIPILSSAERLLTRLTSRKAGRGFRSNIIGCLRKP